MDEVPRDEDEKHFSVAGWSSLVARRAHNPKVVGSNPAPATNLPELSIQELRKELRNYGTTELRNYRSS